MNSNTRWTKEEESFLEREYPENHAKEIAEVLGRTVMSVTRKSIRMGIYKKKKVSIKKEKDEMTAEKERLLNEIEKTKQSKNATALDKKKCKRCKKIKLGKEFEVDYRTMKRRSICWKCKVKAVEENKNKRIIKGRDW